MSSARKYDVEITAVTGSEIETHGYILDHLSQNPSVEVSDPDPSLAGLSSSSNAAGVYDWKDQRSMPGVSISDFRGGAGQKILDRDGAIPTAFLDSRFINCEVEGEISLAQSFIFVPQADIENVIIEGPEDDEGNGTVWASFHPKSGEGTTPDSIRYLKRYQVTLSASLDADDTPTSTLEVTDDTDVELGDWLYDPFCREVVGVTDYTNSVWTVTRSYGYFDEVPIDLVPPDAVDHASGTVLYGYGWRVVPFDDQSQPLQHIQSLACDGSSIWAAITDDEGYGSIWRYGPTDTNGFVNVLYTGVDGVTDLCYGLGTIYCASAGSAGYLSRDPADGVTIIYSPLSASMVTGQIWKTPVGQETDGHYEDEVTEYLMPSVSSKALKMGGTWCYWLVNAGGVSTLYRIQSPVGFELVYSFPKGFRATCMEGAFSNIYVGGYQTAPDGVTEGTVYLINGSTVESIVSLDAVGNDNTIMGLTAVGKTIRIVTGTALYCYSPKSGGWWHVANLPIGNPSIDPIPSPESDFDDELNLTATPESDENWTILATSATAPVLTTDNGGDGSLFMKALGQNGRYRRWEYTGTIDSDEPMLVLASPAMYAGFHPNYDDYPNVHRPGDGWGAVGKRRIAELSVSNGSYETRARITATRYGDYWVTHFFLGRYSTKYSGWNFTDPALISYTGSHWKVFLTPGQLFVQEEESYVLQPLYNPLNNSPGRATTERRIWFSAGIKIGESILYDTDQKKWRAETLDDVNNLEFQANLSMVQVIAEAVAPSQPTVINSTGSGAAAEMQGELFIPSAADPDSVDPSGFLNFTRVGELYTGDNAYLETSDSYQGMGTAMKHYRRFEVAYPSMDTEQEITALALVDGKESPALTISGGDGTSIGQLAQQVIGISGMRARVRVNLKDEQHLRSRTDRLRVNSLALRFLTASSPLKEVYTFNCIESVECRDGTRWDEKADAAIDFIRRMKKSGIVLNVTTDRGTFDAYIDSYVLRRSAKDEQVGTVEQGTVEVTFRMFDG